MSLPAKADVKSYRWMLPFGACLTALGIVLAVPSQAGAAIIKGPHLQDVRTDGVTVVWEQTNAGPGSVTIDGKELKSPDSKTLHEVVVSGLKAASSYSYTVQADGDKANGSFGTAPANPVCPFTFVVAGDNRSDHVSHQLVVDAIIKELPLAFLQNTGDMVSSGEVAADWQSFFDIERALIKNVPWYPLVGNHEEDGGKLPAFYPNLMAPPTTTSGNEAYYSYTYANSAFIVLDGHVNVKEELFGVWTNFDDKQLAWLAQVLGQYSADPAIQHIFVLNHEPPYSSKEGRFGNHAMRLLNPLFAQHKVDAIISGHDHYLERGESPQGLRYYIMGGGGAPLYKNESEGNLGSKGPGAIPWFDDLHTVHFAKKTHGYLLVSVANGQVDAEVKDISGNVLDTLSWNTGDVVDPNNGNCGSGGGGTAGAGPGGSGAGGLGQGGGNGSGASGAGNSTAGAGPTTSSSGSGAAGGDPGSSQEAGCGCATPGAVHPYGKLTLLLLLLGGGLIAMRRSKREQSS